MKRVLLILAVLLLIALPAAAQQTCRDGNACNGVPWIIAVPPRLYTPTPIPTIAITVQPASPTPTYTTTPYTPTPPFTNTPPFDVSDMQHQLETLQAIVNNPEPTLALGTTATPAWSGAVQLFGFVQGIQQVNFGRMSPLIGFMFFALFTYLAVRFGFVILPIIAALFGIVRKIVQIILDFLPG